MANHWVKLEIPALAAEYAGILVSGVYAFIDETLRMQPAFFATISFANTCVGSNVPKKFKLKTQQLSAYKLIFNFKTDSAILNYLNGKTIKI